MLFLFAVILLTSTLLDCSLPLLLCEKIGLLALFDSLIVNQIFHSIIKSRASDRSAFVPPIRARLDETVEDARGWGISRYGKPLGMPLDPKEEVLFPALDRLHNPIV